MSEHLRQRSLTRLFLLLLTLTVAVACHDEPPTAPSPVCTYALTPAGQTFDSQGGKGTTTITTASDCAWAATTNSDWIAVVGAAEGNGPATIAFTVAPNPTTQARSGALVIGGVTFTISEAGGACAYDVSPHSGVFAAEGGNGTLAVTASPACEWAATSSEPWLTIVSGGSGTGDGTVAYRVASQTGLVDRTATITIAGIGVSIVQTAFVPPPPPPPTPDCTYSVAPTEFLLHWHHTGGEIAVTTADRCGWTVSAAEDWLTVQTPAESSGSGIIRFLTSAFTEQTSRRAPVRVRWPTVTAGQNVWITQEGCWYGISAKTQTAPAAGATQMVFVVSSPISTSCAIGCPWNAVSQVPWIHVLSAMPRSGDDPFSYRVDANTTGASRIGQIVVGSLTLTVTQAGS